MTVIAVSNITQLTEARILCIYINAQERSKNLAQNYLPVISQAFRVSLNIEINNNNSEGALHYVITYVTATSRILLLGLPRLYLISTFYSSSVQVIIIE